MAVCDSFCEPVRKLRSHDARFGIDRRRGKASHRMQHRCLETPWGRAMLQ